MRFRRLWQLASLGDLRRVVTVQNTVLHFNNQSLEFKFMIIVIATVTCTPGNREAFLAEFRQLVPDVLAEEGCIEYGPTVDAVTDLEKQNVAVDRVTICEKWESLSHLKAHLLAPHMNAYRPKVRDLVASSELRVLESA